jgi:rhodanese-related sulfurtransferase
MRSHGMEGNAHRALAGLVGAVVLSLGAASGAWAAETPDKLDGVKVVTATEAKQLADRGATMIDTRVASENAEKTIKGAKSVVYREKSAKDVKFDRTQDSWDLSKLPSDKNAPIVTFCNGAECWKSYKSAVLARDAGYKQVYWLRGGLPEWAAKGLPTQ